MNRFKSLNRYQKSLIIIMVLMTLIFTVLYIKAISKVELLNWFVGVFLCIINVLYIMFADEWFRFGLSFTVRDAEYAEPTDLQIANRYLSWTIITIVALVLFFVGLMF